MRETGDHEEGPPVIGPRRIMQRTHRALPHFVVVQQLVGDFGHARAGDAAHVVVPPVDALVWLSPVGRPAKIGGVNIGGAALLKPMQLVRPDEMHLAAEHGAVPGVAQVMRHRGHGAGQISRVVKTPGLRWQLPGHQAIARRGAQGAVGIRRVKHHALRSKAVDIGRDSDLVAVAGQGPGGDLVVHDDQDVGALGGVLGGGSFCGHLSILTEAAACSRPSSSTGSVPTSNKARTAGLKNPSLTMRSSIAISGS